MEESHNKYILGIIGIVAVVGLFMMMTNSKGGVETVSGEAVKMMKAQPQNTLNKATPIIPSTTLRRAKCIYTDPNNNPFLRGEVITLDAAGVELEHFVDGVADGEIIKPDSLRSPLIEYTCEGITPKGTETFIGNSNWGIYSNGITNSNGEFIRVLTPTGGVYRTATPDGIIEILPANSFTRDIMEFNHNIYYRYNICYNICVAPCPIDWVFDENTFKCKQS